MLLTIAEETLHIIIPVLGRRSSRTKQQAGSTKQLFLRFTSTKPFLLCVQHCLEASTFTFQRMAKILHWSLSNKKIFLQDFFSLTGTFTSSGQRELEERCRSCYLRYTKTVLAELGKSIHRSLSEIIKFISRFKFLIKMTPSIPSRESL